MISSRHPTSVWFGYLTKAENHQAIQQTLLRTLVSSCKWYVSRVRVTYCNIDKTHLHWHPPQAHTWQFLQFLARNSHVTPHSDEHIQYHLHFHWSKFKSQVSTRCLHDNTAAVNNMRWLHPAVSMRWPQRPAVNCMRWPKYPAANGKELSQHPDVNSGRMLQRPGVNNMRLLQCPGVNSKTVTCQAVNSMRLSNGQL